LLLRVVPIRTTMTAPQRRHRRICAISFCIDFSSYGLLRGRSAKGVRIRPFAVTDRLGGRFASSRLRGSPKRPPRSVEPLGRSLENRRPRVGVHARSELVGVGWLHPREPTDEPRKRALLRYSAL